MPSRSSSKIDPLIAKHLGPKAVPTKFVLGKRRIAGFRAPTKLGRQAIERLTRELRTHGICVFVTGSELHAIPDGDPLDIVEIAGVGTHNANEPDAWRPIRAALANLYKRFPFDIPLADAAGMVGLFHTKLTDATARSAAKLLCEVPSGFELMENEVASIEVDDEDIDEDISPDDEDLRRGFDALFPVYLKKRGGFHLWWD